MIIDRPLATLNSSTKIREASAGPTAWRQLARKVHNVPADSSGSSHARDAARVPALLKQVERPLAWVAADSAYDTDLHLSLLMSAHAGAGKVDVDGHAGPAGRDDR